MKSETARNQVLAAMRSAGFVSEQEYAAAIETPLRLAPSGTSSESTAIATITSVLATQFRDADFEKQTYRVFSTLDSELQADAEAAVGASGAALVALDPHSGEIVATTGGIGVRHRLNAAFQPFVYAAALNTATQSVSVVFVPSSREAESRLTLRDALAHSSAGAAVKLASQAGYQSVASLAKRAGLDPQIEPGADMALGAFDATALEIAGAYTTFANGGQFVVPSVWDTVWGPDDRVLFHNSVRQKPVLDPRVAYLMSNMMEESLRSGTAVEARTSFDNPAAVMKDSGDSGWVAGFTSGLLCVVWTPESSSPGSLRIWTAFMKQAATMPRYRAAGFPAPQGIVSLQIDPASGMPATPACPEVRTEVYVAGTQPVGTCPLHVPGATVSGQPETEPKPGVKERGILGRIQKIFK